MNIAQAVAGREAREILDCPDLLIDTKTGNIVHEFEERKAPSVPANTEDVETVRSFGFSADGQRLAVGWSNGGAEIWNVPAAPAHKAARRCRRSDDIARVLADKRFLLGGSRDAGIFVWSLETGKVLRTLEREGVAGHVSTGSVAISPDSELVAAGPRQRATSSGDVGRERRVQVWDLASGKLRFLFSGHEANVNALLFTSDGRWIVSGSNDGTIRYWDRRTRSLGATFAAAPDGRWVMVTDKGFFAASANAGDLLSVVHGYEATSIDQMWQSLYAPDLYRASGGRSERRGEAGGSPRRFAEGAAQRPGAGRRDTYRPRSVARPDRTLSTSRPALRTRARASAASNGGSTASRQRLPPNPQAEDPIPA